MEQVATTPFDPHVDDARSPVSLRSRGRGARAQADAADTPALRTLPVAWSRPADAETAHLDRRTAEGPPHNLPRSLTSFIGREREIAEVGRLLATSRLLTLTGAGGVGKTRLGYEVAAGLLAQGTTSPLELPDGVWLVELAALADPMLVPQTVATVLSLREDGDRPPMATVVGALRTRAMLLVLDNCEHVIEACAVLAEAVLRACPNVRILATSRQTLGITGEVTFLVPTLSLSSPERRAGGPSTASDCDAVSDVSPAAQSEAVRLFVERAQAVRPALSLTDDRLAIIEQICRRLDGMPLAIELAAARVGILTPEQIADRLSDRFRLLTAGSRTALPRCRTLRAMIDWSHDLLDEREQILLRRLAVFTGGWTLEAAESVCAGDGLDADEILDLLSGLAAKSLVLTAEHADEIRYTFLESLREYAAGKLREAGEESILQARHRDWFLALAERAAPELRGPLQHRWLDRLDRDRENLRAVQRHAVAVGDAETTARLGGALWLFWWARAEAAETREWINTIAPLARRAQPTQVLAQALHGAGMLAGSLADYPGCHALLREAVAVARQIGDRSTLASVLDSLGRQTSFEGRYAEARGLFTEALELHHQIADRQALASALSRFGFLVYLEGDHATARATLTEGIEVAREAGDPAMVAEILDKLGQIDHSDGDLAGALEYFQQAERIWRELGQGHWLAMTLNNLGNTQTLLGELDAARANLGEALSLSRRLGNRRRMAFTLSSIATLAALEGDAVRALRLDAASAGAVVQMGIQRVPPRVPLRAHILERARRELSPTAAAVAEATGQATTLTEAVEEALSWLAEPGRSTTPERYWAAEDRPVLRTVPPVLAAAPTLAQAPASQPRPAGLSPRELDVLRLLAAGRTSKEVADDLVLSVRTVERHITHIYGKIGARGRADATLFALRHQLVS